MSKTISIADDVSFNSNTTGVNSGTGYTYPSGVHKTTPGFCGFPVAQCLVFFVEFCWSLFVLLFCFVWCFAWTSSICGFWLTPLWYFQTFLNSNTNRIISGTGTDNSSAIPEYTPGFCGFVLLNLLSSVWTIVCHFCHFIFGHWIVSPFSI